MGLSSQLRDPFPHFISGHLTFYSCWNLLASICILRDLILTKNVQNVEKVEGGKRDYHKNGINSTVVGWWVMSGCFGSHVLTRLYIFQPVTNILIRIKDKVGRAGHVVLPLSFAHEILGTISLVRVVGNVTVLLLTRHLICYILQ